MELIEYLESNQAKCDDSDWKDEETSENPDWNRSLPSSPPHSYHSSPIINHDFSRHFKFIKIAIASCPKEGKPVRLLHPDMWKPYKPFTKEEGSKKIKYVSNTYEALMEYSILLKFLINSSICTSMYLRLVKASVPIMSLIGTHSVYRFCVFIFMKLI